MAAPTFIVADVGTVTTGVSINVQVNAGLGQAVGDLIIVQIMADGAASSDPSLAGVSAGSITNLAGTAQAVTVMTPAGGEALGAAGEHYLFACRLVATTILDFTWATDTAVDHYARPYVFRDVNTGTTLNDIHEGYGASSGILAAMDDQGVTTTGVDRLAVNFVAVNDDNPLAEFTGMTGGTWSEATAEYTQATGTDAALQLQTAAMASAGTINGGSQTMAADDGWSVIGFALIGTTVVQNDAEVYWLGA